MENQRAERFFQERVGADKTKAADTKYWLQRWIAIAESIGIGKKELLEDYYLDEEAPETEEEGDLDEEDPETEEDEYLDEEDSEIDEDYYLDDEDPEIEDEDYYDEDESGEE